MLFAAASPQVRAETGVSSDTILFGQAAVLEGPASALGQGMRQGILAAFAEVNAKGGVHGRKLKLISANDGYEPDRSIVRDHEADRRGQGLRADRRRSARRPRLPRSRSRRARSVPFIGPVHRRGLPARHRSYDNVVNVRASYDAETEAWVKHLTEDLKFTKIAIFYQDDAFGRAGLAGVKRALEKRSMEIERRRHVRAQHHAATAARCWCSSARSRKPLS